MAYEQGEAKVINPQKEIAKEIVLDVVMRHRDAIKQARTGERPNIDIAQITDEQKKFNQVKALVLIISAQREMITISRPIIFNNCEKQWKKRYPEEEKRKLFPFEDYKCDYKEILTWLEFLKECMHTIEIADRTRNKDDDFIKEIINHLGEKEYILTNNFYEMLDDLEGSYEQIYLRMIRHKIVSSGVEEDDDMSYKEKEKEAISRIVGA